MAKIFYNWEEIKRKGKNNPEWVVFVAYTLYLKYSGRSAKLNKYILYVLNIQNIPKWMIQDMYESSYVIRKVGYIPLYTCKEPVAYFENPKFLWNKIATTRHKNEYLYLLNMRSIGDLSARIPTYFLEEKQLNWALKNPFIRKVDEYLIFVPELERKKYGSMDKNYR